MNYLSHLDQYLDTYPGSPRQAVLATRLVFHAAHRLEQRIEQALAPCELTMREYLALANIAIRTGEAIKPSELSVSLDATRTQITRLLDALENRGLVKRKLSAEDRRSLELSLTAAGSRLLRSASPLVHAAYADCWSALREAELKTMNEGLQRLNTSLREREGM
jgi:MarR family transcriptional repressor of emrRAB